MATKGKGPRRPYKLGNEDGNGSYLVGRNRPPKSGQFAENDGRRRGRRAKGVRNFDTDFREEAARKVAVRENGQERRRTKQRASIIRLFDNAFAKGQNQALALVFTHLTRLEEKRAEGDRLSHADEELLDAWIEQRAAALRLGDPSGDPAADQPEAGDAEDDLDSSPGEEK